MKVKLINMTLMRTEIILGYRKDHTKVEGHATVTPPSTSPRTL
jgi:hypothetical protein